MKDNYEWEENDLFIPRYMEVDSNIGQEITVYIGAWEDMREKFGIKTDNDMYIPIDMYAKFNPYADTLRIECKISAADNRLNMTFDYDATDAERKLIKMLVIDRIKAAYKQTPKEFCESAATRKLPSQMNAAEYAVIYEPYFPKSTLPYVPQDNATIRFSHISFYKDGEWFGAGWHEGHLSYEDLLTDDFTKSVMSDHIEETIDVKVEYYEYGNGSIHRDITEDETLLLCMSALHNGDRLCGKDVYSITAADIITADEDESQDIGMTM